jgi:hypothetical protein
VHRARPDAELIGINYGDPFPWDKIDKETEVIMVDFSLQPIEGMVRLQEACERLVWIDHHESSIKEAALHPALYSTPGLRVIGKAACELAWEWLFEEPMPMSVYLLGRYDVFALDDHPDVLPFQWGMRSLRDTSPGFTPLWVALFSGDLDSVEHLCEVGKTLVEFQATQDAKACSGCAFPAELDGLKVIAMNRGIVNSLSFKSVWDPSLYDAMCAFVRRPNGVWTVSLYTDRDDVDVGEFCKRHGGGGHRRAAGYQMDRSPF